MNFDAFKFSENSALSNFATRFDGGMAKKELKRRTRELYAELFELQECLYAENKQSLLIVLQAMDAAGKDSTIEKLTQHINAQGCLVHSFKKPTERELERDFLWRVHKCVPALGEFAIFNRSHYEDVLIVKVHGLADAQRIENRYTHIRNFEALLEEKGTRILKFMLHVSPEYQLSRFKNRLENEEKHWKFNPSDLRERQHWDAYMEAFEIAMQRCSTEHAPWYVVPAEDRRFRDFMLASIIVEALKQMDPSYPEPVYKEEDFPVDSLV